MCCKKLVYPNYTMIGVTGLGWRLCDNCEHHRSEDYEMDLSEYKIGNDFGKGIKTKDTVYIPIVKNCTIQYVDVKSLKR